MKVVRWMIALVVSVGVVGSMGICDGVAEGINEMGDRGELPEVYIKAVNPGYTVDGASNVGEMIELGYSGAVGRAGPDNLIPLAGYQLSYTNTSGKEVVISEFSEHMFMAGETILLRLASAPDAELANLTYAKTLALKAGPLALKRGEEIVDSVCWTSKEGCAKEFKAAEPTSLVRDEATGEFRHIAGYEATFFAENLVVEDEASAVDYSDETGVKRCLGVIISEVFSYYEETRAEQFVELHNTRAEQVLLDGCAIRYKNKLYPVTGVIAAEGYLVRREADLALTKNPTSTNSIELLDVDGEVVDSAEYPNGQRRGASYALVGYNGEGEEIWRVTYAVTPGEPNVYQEYRSCAEGKVINEATGNCVKVTEVAEKICAEGQYLNILTGRCKKIEEVKVTECKEGYYLNEETGRCRKIVENDGAELAIVPETYAEESSFVAVYVVLGVLGLAMVYVGWEFRREIWRLGQRVFRRFR